jgi:hypothetical protein
VPKGLKGSGQKTAISSGVNTKCVLARYQHYFQEIKYEGNIERKKKRERDKKKRKTKND